MKKIFVIGVVVSIFLLGAVFFFKKVSDIPANSQIIQERERFSDYPHAKDSVKIFPGMLTPEGKKALAGFNLEIKQLPNRLTQVTLVALKSSYKTQSYTLRPGDVLYFYDSKRDDDSMRQDSDGDFSDDTAILVDSRGYIIQ